MVLSGDGGRPGSATILIGDRRYPATLDEPFVFGRFDAPGVTGLDPSDMGISARAGGVELAWGLWWVVNHSSKRRLVIEDSAAVPRRLECGDR